MVPFDDLYLLFLTMWTWWAPLFFYLFRWSFAHFHPFSWMVLVDKVLFFHLNGHSIIFKFDLPLSGRKEPLYTGSVILLISQSIDSMWFK